MRHSCSVSRETVLCRSGNLSHEIFIGCVSMFLLICCINKNQCLVSLHLQTLAAACGKFAPFEIKENMALAPLTRVQCKDSVLEELDHCLLNPVEKANALKDWIGRKPRQSGATKPRRTDSLR